MLTITEALAEVKTIGKRIEKKRQFVVQYLMRQDMVRDPLEKDGGSVDALKRERQAISDLEQRVVDIRSAIARANDTNSITVKGKTRTIHDWLTWRREVAPGHQAFLGTLRQGITNIREQQRKLGVTVGTAAEITKPQDVVVNINERDLAEEIENTEEILGTLDGQLSLKNATITIAA